MMSWNPIKSNTKKPGEPRQIKPATTEWLKEKLSMGGADDFDDEYETPITSITNPAGALGLLSNLTAGRHSARDLEIDMSETANNPEATNKKPDKRQTPALIAGNAGAAEKEPKKENEYEQIKIYNDGKAGLENKSNNNKSNMEIDEFMAQLRSLLNDPEKLDYKKIHGELRALNPWESYIMGLTRGFRLASNNLLKETIDKMEKVTGVLQTSSDTIDRAGKNVREATKALRDPVEKGDFSTLLGEAKSEIKKAISESADRIIESYQYDEEEGEYEDDKDQGTGGKDDTDSKPIRVEPSSSTGTTDEDTYRKVVVLKAVIELLDQRIVLEEENLQMALSEQKPEIIQSITDSLTAENIIIMLNLIPVLTMIDPMFVKQTLEEELFTEGEVSWYDYWISNVDQRKKDSIKTRYCIITGDHGDEKST